MSEYDPYQPPETDIVSSREASIERLRLAVRKWETLRIPFNIILLAVGVLASWHLVEWSGGIGFYMFELVIYGVTLNVFYCLGPLAETYLSVFTSLRMEKFRLPLFIAGTLACVLLTLVLVLFSGPMLLPDQP